GVVGIALWWSPPCRVLVEAGDLDMLVGGMCVPVYLSWLARYGRAPGRTEWLVLTASSAIGWFMQPLLMAGVVALALLFHLWMFRGVRFAWHIGLLSANVIGLAANSFWLSEWLLPLRLYVPSRRPEAPRP